MGQLAHPAPLDARIFYSQAAVDAYNDACADFFAQQEQDEYNSAKSPKRKHQSRRDQYNNQD